MCRGWSYLTFTVSGSEVRKEILNLSSKKATKNGDIPAKILKKSVDIYIREIIFIVNDCIKMEFFLIILNWLMYHLYLIRKVVLKKEIIDRLAYYHTCQKSLKGYFINKLIFSWLQNFLLIYAVLEKKHDAQYPFLKMIETWKIHLDKGEKIG